MHCETNHMKYVARTVVKTEHFQQASRINNSKPLSLGKQKNCQNAARWWDLIRTNSQAMLVGKRNLHQRQHTSIKETNDFYRVHCRQTKSQAMIVGLRSSSSFLFSFVQQLSWTARIESKPVSILWGTSIESKFPKFTLDSCVNLHTRLWPEGAPVKVKV